MPPQQHKPLHRLQLMLMLIRKKNMNIGRVSENIYKRSVEKYINQTNNEIKKGATAGADCALFVSDDAVITTAVGYCSEPHRLCGSHAVYRACAKLACKGGVPGMFNVTITLPEKYREIKLKEIVADICKAALAVKARIDNVYAETVAGIELPVVSVSVVGFRTKEVMSTSKQSLAGASIVMTRWMAMSGAARIAEEHRDELLGRYPSFIVDDAMALEQFYNVIPEAAVAVNSGALRVQAISDGGVFAGLWELADRDGVGLEVNLHDIPVRQESIEVCEFFDINPYKLESDGSILIVTNEPDELIGKLTAIEVQATQIGRITEGLDRVLIADEERRFLEPPRQDEVHMI